MNESTLIVRKQTPSQSDAPQNGSPPALPVDANIGDELAAGVMLERYQIETVLGRGGFGVTYKAFDTRLHRYVAIKEYLPNRLAYRDRLDNTVRSRSQNDDLHFEKFRSRFLDEARMLANFSHPNLVQVLTFFEENKTVYLVMAFVEGESLAALLAREGPLTQEHLLAVMLPLMGGLQALHRKKVIHRDIKPDNILVCKDGTPILLDFGSARLTIAHGESQTMTAILTPGYAPLEQYDSDGTSQGSWTDIYALGAVMYHAISGKKPTASFGRSRVLINMNSDPLLSASLVGQGKYSPELLKSIDWALRMNPLERPQDVAEWLLSFPGLKPRQEAPNLVKNLQKGRILRIVFVLVILAGLGGVMVFKQNAILEKTTSSSVSARALVPVLAPPVPVPDRERKRAEGAMETEQKPTATIPTAQNSQSPASWQVTLTTSRGQKEGIYHTGEEIQFQVVVNQSAYLYLFNIDSDGTIIRLFPLSGHHPPRIAPGSPFHIPTPEMGFDIKAEAPFGIGKVWVVVTSSPLKLPADKNPAWKREEMLRKIVIALGKKSGGFAEDSVRVVTQP